MRAFSLSMDSKKHSIESSASEAGPCAKRSNINASDAPTAPVVTEQDLLTSCRTRTEELVSSLSPYSILPVPSSSQVCWQGPDNVHEIFQRYDEDRSGQLDSCEFGKLLHEILGTGGPLPDDKVQFLLSAFDTDGDGIVSFQEIERAWSSWFAKASKPVQALIIVDVQNDFIGGTLALKHCPAGQTALRWCLSSTSCEHPSLSMQWRSRSTGTRTSTAPSMKS